MHRSLITLALAGIAFTAAYVQARVTLASAASRA
jgi:hypothetical protein